MKMTLEELAKPVSPLEIDYLRLRARFLNEDEQELLRRVLFELDQFRRKQKGTV